MSNTPVTGERVYFSECPDYLENRYGTIVDIDMDGCVHVRLSVEDGADYIYFDEDNFWDSLGEFKRESYGYCPENDMNSPLFQ